jgi:hypothetical protein
MIDFIISKAGQGPQGLISDNGGHAASYVHGIATYALGEAYIMTGDPELREPFLGGIKKILQAQAPDGGWMYEMDGRSQDSDTSVSGWQIQALKSAYLAGLEEVAEEVSRALDDAVNNMERVHMENGSFGYRGPGGHGRLTGVGVFCMSVWKHLKSREARKGADYLMEYLEKDHPARMTDGNGRLIYDRINIYSLYYDVQAMFAQGGREWRQFNDWFQDTITANQASDGSWPPTNGEGSYPGSRDDGDFRIYRNALMTLTLEVYYRYLPVVDM